MEASQDTAYTAVLVCTKTLDLERLTEFLTFLWKTPEINVINAPAPEKIFAEQGDTEAKARVRNRIDEALAGQSLKRLALVAHDADEENPVPHAQRMEMLRKSIDLLATHYPEARVAGVAVDASGVPFQIEL